MWNPGWRTALCEEHVPAAKLSEKGNEKRREKERENTQPINLAPKITNPKYTTSIIFTITNIQNPNLRIQIKHLKIPNLKIIQI